MTAPLDDMKIFESPNGVPYARVPAGFPERCRGAELGLQEENVLIELMTYQLVSPDGALYLRDGTSNQIAKSCGMSAPNVRKAIAGLREKGVLAKTIDPRIHRLLLDVWGRGASDGKRLSVDSGTPCDSSENHPALTEGSFDASPGKRVRFCAEAPTKNEEEVKSTHKKHAVMRMDYD